MDERGLRALFAGCGPQLRVLQLAGCVGVEPSVLDGLGAACPRLASLSVRGLALRDEHVIALVRGRSGRGVGSYGRCPHVLVGGRCARTRGSTRLGASCRAAGKSGT